MLSKTHGVRWESIAFANQSCSSGSEAGTNTIGETKIAQQEMRKLARPPDKDHPGNMPVIRLQTISSQNGLYHSLKTRSSLAAPSGFWCGHSKEAPVDPSVMLCDPLKGNIKYSTAAIFADWLLLSLFTPHPLEASEQAIEVAQVQDAVVV